MSARVYAYVVSAIVCAAVASPVMRAPFDDGFPLSTYPMFSRPRPSPVVTVNYALGIEPNGTRHHLSPSHVANDEVLLARAVLDRTAHASTPDKMKLCRRVASRVATLGPGSVVEVRLVRGTHDTVKFLTGAEPRGKESVWIRCAVTRRR